LEALSKAKDLELEQKEQNLSLTLEKYSNLQMIIHSSHYIPKGALNLSQ